MFNNYLKFAWRHIRKSPGYSFINIAGLAIGIASVVLIFMYIQHELSFDDYHENKDRLYRITSYSGFNEKSWRAATPGDPVPEFRTNYSSIEDGVRLMNCGAGTVKVDGDDYTDLETYCTESNLFNVFSFPLLAKSREDLLEVPYTAVISRSTAKKIFGEVNPVGRTFEMPWGSQGDTETFEITGIMEDIPVNTHFRHDIYLSPGFTGNYRALYGLRRSVSIPSAEGRSRYYLTCRKYFESCQGNRREALC